MEDILGFKEVLEICGGLSGTKAWSHKRYTQKNEKFSEGGYKGVK